MGRVVMRSKRRAAYSYPSSAEIKNTWSYTSTATCLLLVCCLIKHRATLPSPFRTKFQRVS